MEIQRFISLYREAFGETAPMPVAFGYGYEPVTEVRKIPRCIVGAIRKVSEGTPP